MNKIYAILFGCVGLLTTFSCTQQDDAFISSDGSNYLQLSTETITRGIVESTTFNVGDEIGVFVIGVDDTDEYVKGSYNIRATYNGSGWVMDKKVLLTDKPARVKAYYPYDSKASIGSLYFDFNDNGGANDCLAGSAVATVDMNSPTAHIVFKHILTRLTFVISCTEGEHLLNSVLLHSAFNKLWTNAIYDVLSESGIENKIIGNNKHYIKKEVNATINDGQSQMVDILVYPLVGEKGEYTLEITLDGKPYIISLPAVKWEAGKRYTYPIEVSISDESSSIK